MKKHLTAIFLAATIALPVASLAAEPKLVNQHRDWGHYSYVSNGKTLCYVTSVATEKLPTTLEHGDIFFLVSHDGNGKFEPQFKSSYNLKEGSTIRLVVDNKEYELFSQGQEAWLQNPAQEEQLIQDMRAGNKMTVSAVSSRNNNTAYTFSLSGITAALRGAGNCR